MMPDVRMYAVTYVYEQNTRVAILKAYTAADAVTQVSLAGRRVIAVSPSSVECECDLPAGRWDPSA